jgi:hypothetical protein
MNRSPFRETIFKTDSSKKDTHTHHWQFLNDFNSSNIQHPDSWMQRTIDQIGENPSTFENSTNIMHDRLPLTTS